MADSAAFDREGVMTRQTPRLHFAVVGAAKAGTTLLAEAVQAHPQAHLPFTKDSHVFFRDHGLSGFTGPGDDHFNKHLATDSFSHGKWPSPGNKKIGDIGAFYLNFQPALDSLLDSLADDGTVVLSLRNPVDRAFSAYMHTVREGRETETFVRALELEEQRRAAGWEPIWWLKACSLYSDGVRHLLRRLPRNSVKIILYEDLAEDPKKTLVDVLTFMGLDPSAIRVPTSRLNQSGVPRSRALQTFLSQPGHTKATLRTVLPRSLWLPVRSRLQDWNLRSSELAVETRRELWQFFEADVACLEEVTGMDLAVWRPTPTT